MQLFTLIDINQSLTLSDAVTVISAPISRNNELLFNVLNANMCTALITTLVTGTAPEIGIYKGDPATASNKIGRIRIGTDRFAVNNIIFGEGVEGATVGPFSNVSTYDEATEGVTGAFVATDDIRFKVDTASTAGVAKIFAAVAAVEGGTRQQSVNPPA